MRAGHPRPRPIAEANPCGVRLRESRNVAAPINGRPRINRPINSRTSSPSYFAACAIIVLGARMTGISPSPTAANADQ